MMRWSLLVCLLILVPLAGCGPALQRAPILVAQSGLAAAQSISTISEATKKLQEATLLPAASALRVQETLLSINGKLKPLPGLLRTIDAAQQAGTASITDLDMALSLLSVVGADLSGVLAGVPITESTQTLLTLVRTAQTTVQTVLVEVARLKGAR